MGRSRPALFKGRHFELEMIILCIRRYLRFFLSYRDVEEGMAERNLRVDHVTIGRWVQRYAPELSRRCPGINSIWNGRATLSTPWKAPNFLGSYSCWKVGQYTKFSGYEGVRQGNCHFAGEHCSLSFQGFMEGAAQEGARAAQEIITDLSA